MIAGGGLAGLTLACDLASRGIPSLLLDEDDTVGVRGASSRGICYAQRSLEIFARLGKTVVLVTHDLAEAAFLGEHLVLLREGQVVQAGPLSELATRPADPFVTRFIQAQRRLAEGRG